VAGTENFYQSWGLDALGNWATYDNNSTSQTRTHDAANELTAASGWASPASDAAGNMTAIPKASNPSSALTLKYDAWNRLTSVSDSGIVLARYDYDAQGRRVLKVLDENADGTPDKYVHFYLNGQQVIETREAASSSTQPESLSPTYQYVWSPRYIDALILRDTYSGGTLQTTSRLYYLNDANFNVTSLVNAAGFVVERYAYSPYGKTTVLETDFTLDANNLSDFSNTTLFAGRELGPETGLYYNRARYYSAELGRFVGRDPIQADANLYRYVLNNPVMYVDPSGLTEVESDKPFPGAKGGNGKYCRHVDDGQTGTVQLKRITWADVHTEEKNLMNQLYGFEKADGEKSRKYEGGFDSKYFAGEGAQHQYYLVDHQNEIYADNQINYIGIGLYEAWLGDSLFKAKLIVWAWKVGRWFDVPSGGTMYWLEEGYNSYTPPLPAPPPPPAPPAPPRR
jgi:RHS repeat-associated protein